MLAGRLNAFSSVNHLMKSVHNHHLSHHLHYVKSVQIRSFFRSVFPRIRILRISPYSVRLRENTDQKKLRIWKLFPQCQLQNTLKQLRGNIKELNSGDIIKIKMLSKDFHHLLWLLYGKIFHRTSFFPKIKFLYTCFTVNWFFDQLDQAVFEYFWLHEHSFTGERNTV